MSVLKIAEEYWLGVEECVERDSVSPASSAGLGEWQEVCPGVFFMLAFGNVAAVDTPSGLVLVDTGSALYAPAVLAAVREFSSKPVHTAIYTHGHIDHCFGIQMFDAEASGGRQPLISVVAHKNVSARFQRYKMTQGYNSVINSRQFGFKFDWPSEYREPDVTYEDSLVLDVGSVRFELYHALGETDDATWVYLPQHRVLCTGDMFIWSTPNCGNPQKVQRYPLEWAAALREMASKGACLLLPGHGPPIVGPDRVKQALEDTARFLEVLCEQALAGINAGLTLNDVLSSIKLPTELMKKPYLRATYDHPLFVVCNLWRRYAGWWDGNPSRLYFPKDSELGAAVCALATPAAVCAHARTHAREGRIDVACALVEFAHKAHPKDLEINELRGSLYHARSETDPCLMSRNIFGAAARDSAAAARDVTGNTAKSKL